VNPSLVVMAAGAGSRFGGAKQAASVGPHGEWLLEYAAFDARRAGFAQVVLIVREELEPLFGPLAARLSPSIETRLAFQRIDDVPPGSAHLVPGRRKPWGTGHAVLAARHVVDGPFAIVNADDFYGPEAYEHGARACETAANSGTSTVIAMRLDRTLSPHGPVKRGWCQAVGNRVSRLEEVMGIERRDGALRASGAHAATPFRGDELVSMNFWVFPPDIFPALHERFEAFLRTAGSSPDAEFLLPEVVNDLISSARLRLDVVEAPGPWFGLTYAEDRPAVVAGLAQLTRQGVYPAPLWPAQPASTAAHTR